MRKVMFACFLRWNLTFVLFVALSCPGEARSFFVASLPEPGSMIDISPAFTPVLPKGLLVHPRQPLDFDFILDSGDELRDPAFIRTESTRIAKYFLAAVTVPEDQLWVNLSPYEQDRIIENDLGRTVLGRDMLAQDYILKQLSASLIYPENGLGKEFWARVYAQAREKFGTTSIPVDTFNKVWISPDKAEVYQNGNRVYITEARLKLMLDQDHQAAGQTADVPDSFDKRARDLAKDMMRSVILPALEKEVNEGRQFAVMRQIYHAAILAKWYREQVQNTLMETAYVGRNRVEGVTADEKNLKEEIYQRYISAFRKGVFDYVREEADVNGGEILPRKYFSGGENLFIDQLDYALSAEKVVLSGSGFSVRVQARTVDAGQLPSLEETQKLRDAVAARFREVDGKADALFSDPARQEELGILISRNTGDQESLFHHVQVSTDMRIRMIYQQVQSLVSSVMGDDANVFPVNLEEIHVTISGEQIGPPDKFVMTLDELAALVQEDIRQGSIYPFSIRLLGPRLMPNGVIVMEYTTSAPGFFYLRQRSGRRINERKGRLPAEVRGFEQNIIHSTVAVIRNPLIGQEKFRELKKSIDAYRQSFVPVDFNVEQITVTAFIQEQRKFSQSVQLDLQVIQGRQRLERMKREHPRDASYLDILADILPELIARKQVHVVNVVENMYRFLAGDYRSLYLAMSPAERRKISFRRYKALLGSVMNRYFQLVSKDRQRFYPLLAVFHDTGALKGERDWTHNVTGAGRLPSLLDERGLLTEEVSYLQKLVFLHGAIANVGIDFFPEDVLSLADDTRYLLYLFALTDMSGRQNGENMATPALVRFLDKMNKTIIPGFGKDPESFVSFRLGKAFALFPVSVDVSAARWKALLNYLERNGVDKVRFVANWSRIRVNCFDVLRRLADQSFELYARFLVQISDVLTKTGLETDQTVTLETGIDFTGLPFEGEGKARREFYMAGLYQRLEQADANLLSYEKDTQEIVIRASGQDGSGYGGIDLRDGIKGGMPLSGQVFRFDPEVMKRVAQSGGLMPIVTGIVPLAKTSKIFY